MKACGFRLLESHKFLCGPWLYRALAEKKTAVSPRRGAFYKAGRVLEILIETPLVKGSNWCAGLRQRVLITEGCIGSREPNLSDPCFQRQTHNSWTITARVGRSYSYIFTVKRKINFGARRPLVDFVASEILHLSSRKPALRHWQSPPQELIARHDG
jgi:hypothetical protein